LEEAENIVGEVTPRRWRKDKWWRSTVSCCK